MKPIWRRASANSCSVPRSARGQLGKQAGARVVAHAGDEGKAMALAIGVVEQGQALALSLRQIPVPRFAAPAGSQRSACRSARRWPTARGGHRESAGSARAGCHARPPAWPGAVRPGWRRALRAAASATQGAYSKTSPSAAAKLRAS
jgi:hypothetical protein